MKKFTEAKPETVISILLFIVSSPTMLTATVWVSPAALLSYTEIVLNRSTVGTNKLAALFLHFY